MDILSHTFSGVAAVSLVLPFTSFNWKQKSTALVLGAVVGAFPDLDAVSLWSGFGNTGSQVYFGKHWYSHHGFNHSIFSGLLLTLLIFVFRTKGGKFISKNDIILSIGLITGFIAHLLEDMPTPFSYWGGVRLFFPSAVYVGGFGKIWWWNNYDIFLLILSITILNLLLSFCISIIKFKKTSVVLSSSLLVFTIFFQINNRHTDYNYIGSATKFGELEQQSKLEQKRILGDKLYYFMVEFDNKIPFYF